MGFGVPFEKGEVIQIMLYFTVRRGYILYFLCENLTFENIQFKETKSATMNIFQNNYFLFKSFVKVELSYVFTINLFAIGENCMFYKNRCFFLLLVIIRVPPIIIDS